ncbi:MAG: TonB-dependent receptor plug domain-containing protein, partial [Acidobacteriota bacterium]
AAGRATLEVAGPGYRAHRQTLEIEAGAVHRVDISLRLEAETAEEIVVDARAGTLPAGAWLLDEGRQRSARLSGYDGLFSAAFSVPGIQRQAGGASFGMRGQGAERVSFVVDGIALVEPFHFRTLGSLAGTVTPGAVESVTFHRGQPPLTHGHRAGGVVEILTAAGRGGLTGRVGVSVESAEASLGGALARGALRWLAAYREGRPKFPETLAELDARPSYFDGLAKVAWALGQRHDLSLQTFTAGDEFVFTPPESPLGLEGFAPSLAIDQSSHHAAARYLLALGSRHALEAQFSDVEVDRQRFGFEIDDHNLGPDRPASFLLYERRETERTVGRLEGRSALSPSLDLRWGGASTRERTRYAYQGFIFYALASVPPDFEDRQDGSFLSATWRPRGDLTIDGGLRHDRSERLGESWLLPRASISLRRGGDG